MRLKKLKRLIDACIMNAGDTNPRVEVWLGNTEYKISKVTQYRIVPDVVICIKKKKV